MKKAFKRDRRSDVEKKFDEQLKLRLEEAESLEDISEALSIMERQRELGNKRRISPDTIAIVAGNLIGIVIILGFERGHIITTKALGFILRGRV